ncbi:MAG: tetratricopeptide repeat protein [Candidatus Binatia bacterium]|nr:tetratricopeptide repeat protein [Candidatus Binatia bacterium]
MRRAVVVSLLLVALLLYLVFLNNETTTFRLAPDIVMQWNTGALVGGAFAAGVLLAFVVGSIQSGLRAWSAWRSGRRERRALRVDEWEESGAKFLWGGEIARARALLHKAWQRRPEDPHAALLLANSFRATGELHRARGVLHDAAAQYHTHPEVLMTLAEVHRELGELGPRIEVLERLRALYPRSPQALRALRDAYIDAERWGPAAQVQETLIPVLPDPEVVAREQELLLSLRYQTAIHLSDPQERVLALENLASSRRAPVPVYVALGDELAAAHRLADASAAWERGLKQHARSVFVHRLLRIASEPKHRDRLRTLLRKLRDGVDADAVRIWLAETFVADQDAENAARELEAIEVPATVVPDIDRLWGEVHRLRGQFDQSIHAYARACREQPLYHCQKCEHVSADWIGVCPKCHGWDTLRARIEIARA